MTSDSVVHSGINSKAAQPDGKPRVLPFVVFHVLCALFFGALVVVSVLGIREFILLIWMAFVAVTAGGQFRAKRPHIGRTIVVTEFTIMMAVVIGAALAPVKEVEQKLAIVITLPAKSMTLAELANHLQ